jgi:hypothetical protein
MRRATIAALTKRQSVLLDRLVTFCERCDSRDLPIRILRVLGYGSFFRGKDRPGDVDLFLVTGENHPLFDRFVSIVKGKPHRRYQELVPAERMRSIAGKDADPMVAEAAGVFSSWLEGFSHAMLYEHKTFIDELFAYNPERFARRVLHGKLPGIRATLDRDTPEPYSKVTHEIWTPERPDVRGAVERIWASDPRADLLKEAEWFEKQSRPRLLQIAVLDRIAARLAKSRIAIVAEKGELVWRRYRLWLQTARIGFPMDLCVQVTERLLNQSDNPELPDPPGYSHSEFAALDTEQLAIIVEDKRQGLKLLRERAYVLRVLTYYLVHWCLLEKRSSNRTKQHYLVEKVSQAIPKREISSKRVMRILTDELERLGIE